MLKIGGAGQTQENLGMLTGGLTLGHCVMSVSYVSRPLPGYVRPSMLVRHFDEVCSIMRSFHGASAICSKLELH